MTLGKIINHEIVFAEYGSFVVIDGRNLFNPNDNTYLAMGFEVLPELEPREGYHTAWRVATRIVEEEEYTVQIPHEETITKLVPKVAATIPVEEPTEEPEPTIAPEYPEYADEAENEPVVEPTEEIEPEPTTEPEVEYEEVTETIVTYTEETRTREIEEEYIEAYYEEDPEPEDPEEVARREAARREAQWKKEFFLTSLGWVRKKASMKDGSVDNFLTDDLPLIAIGLQNGQIAKIFVYATPDYTQEIDPLALQSYVDVTPLFIKECLEEKQREFV